MRRCKLPTCKIPIDSAAKSVTHYGKSGFCSADHGTEHAMDALRASQERAQATERKKARERAAKQKRDDRERKKALKDNDRRHQWKLTKKAAQKLGRLLDAGKGCISCGRPDDGSVQFCGGHFRTGGAQPELALDIRNIMGQCNKRCNLELSGNIHGNKTTHGYRHGIIERYGQGFLDWLDSYHESPDYTCQQLIEIRKTYLAEIRRLEAGHGPSRDWRALDEGHV